MSDPASAADLIPDLTAQAAAVGALAKDPKLFQAAVEAFRAGQGQTFQDVLKRVGVVEHCELVCRWIRIKECVRRCLLICGPPVAADVPTVRDVPGYAAALAHVAADPKLVEALAKAVEAGDGAGFHRLIDQLKLTRFCHFICFWICLIHTRLLCEVVCSPRPVRPVSLAGELAIASAAVAAVAKDAKVLDQVVQAAVAQNCRVLEGLIGRGGRCIHICEWICSWHCVLNCLTLARPFPVPQDLSVAEMQAFAQACARLAGADGGLAKAVAAVGGEDANGFATLVRQDKLERFALQLCHWICFEICRRFCICVCPPAETIPLFTHVGSYRVDPIWGDFTADGTTTAGNLAFTSTIPLIGLLPDGSTPTAMEYRFLTEKYPLGGGAAPVTAAMIAPTVIGQLEYWEWLAGPNIWVLRSANYWVNNPNPATNTVTIQQPGPPLTVSVNKTVAADGWIAVPRENALFYGGVGRFVPQGTLADLMTTTLTHEAFDLTVAAPPLPVKAGDPVPAAQRSEKAHFRISFEARNAVSHAALSSNARDKIALSNTAYTYNRHPDWAGSPPAPPTVSTAVVSLDIQELIASGCKHLHGHIHALFTAYHPYLGTCEVFLQGPGVPPPAPVNPPIGADGQALSPAGGQDFDISTLKPCAYILWLRVTLNLTVGYGKLPGEIDDVMAFCTE